MIIELVAASPVSAQQRFCSFATFAGVVLLEIGTSCVSTIKYTTAEKCIWLTMQRFTHTQGTKIESFDVVTYHSK